MEMPKRRKTDEVEEVIYERCCGMDVHKENVVACLNIHGKKEVRTFSTLTHDLLTMAQWFKQNDVQMVAMESTGSYWKPVFNILESEEIPAMLVNPQHIKNFTDPKTDVRDSRWISNLLRHGLLRASFVPKRDMRELRELVKYRSSLCEDSVRTLNRIDKVLQGANIKLSSVISTTDTKTELAIIGALANGISDTSELAELAQGTLRNKKEQIKLALNGLMGNHQRLLLKSMYNHLRQIQEEIAVIEAEIDKRMEKDNEIIERLDEIPGVGKITAQAILAEIGTDMDQFPDEAHLASWAGVCPSQNESAGKRKSGKTKKGGNSNLKKTLVQCANSAAHSKDSYLSAQFKQIAARRGSKRARLAVAHSILIICYFIIQTGLCYHDLGSDYFDKHKRKTIVRCSVKRLESLGYEVSIKLKEEAREAS
jgi:transposase